VNSPYPLQIMQNGTYVAFLFEQSTWFHVVPFRNAPPENVDPTWFGTSSAKWDGDTLVVETTGFNGFTRLDTKGNPHSDKMKRTQRFTRTDAGHISYVVTIDDPGVLPRSPGTNSARSRSPTATCWSTPARRTTAPCGEGRIKIWCPRHPN
jgi:hypothetical protein